MLKKCLFGLIIASFTTSLWADATSILVACKQYAQSYRQYSQDQIWLANFNRFLDTQIVSSNTRLRSLALIVCSKDRENFKSCFYGPLGFISTVTGLNNTLSIYNRDCFKSQPDKNCRYTLNLLQQNVNQLLYQLKDF